MNETMFKIIELAVLVIVAVIARYVVPALKAATNNEKYDQMLAFIVKTMEAAEILVKGTGADKKAYVVARAKEWMEKLRINMTDEQISILIEGVFSEIDGDTINTYKK